MKRKNQAVDILHKLISHRISLHQGRRKTERWHATVIIFRRSVYNCEYLLIANCVRSQLIDSQT